MVTAEEKRDRQDNDTLRKPWHDTISEQDYFYNYSRERERKRNADSKKIINLTWSSGGCGDGGGNESLISSRPA